MKEIKQYETAVLKGRTGAKKAAALLAAGEIVAIPTETVYGLAADARDPEAVARIFRAKGRPQDNPLIVHIAAMEQLAPLVRRIPPMAYQLAERFWPGPLTMVMEKSDRIPAVTSAGLDTVGIRMPSHPMAREIIRLSGCPLAAPSANTSGKPSPTTARDTLDDMRGKIPAVVDGGPCAVGVESTVVDMTGDYPKILRPGAITEEMIAQAVGGAETDAATLHGLAAGERPKAPGMKYRHYAPKAPVRLFEGPPDRTAEAVLQALQPGDGVLCFEEYLPQLGEKKKRLVYSLGWSWDYAEHSRRLFALLRRFDHTGARRILAQCPRAFGTNAGAVNRFRKSAGFQCEDCREGRLVVGVTGRSGSGKSLLTGYLAEQGAFVLDADAIYHTLLETDGEMLEQIGRRFPGTVENGGLDRRALGAVVFADPQALADLNAITHGRVKAYMDRAIRETDRRLVVLDVPLLFESGIDRLCDLTLGLLADREGALRRIMARDGIDRERAERRLDAQPADGFYRARCDVLLENRGTLAEYREKIARFYEKYCGGSR